MARPKKYQIELTDEEVLNLKSIIRKKATSKTICCRCQIILDLNEAHGKVLTHKQSARFGTDQYGRDIFVRIVFGARISLIVALSTAGIGLVFGTVIGAAAGYYGGKIDNTLIRFMDVFLAIPSMLLAICIVGILSKI